MTCSKAFALLAAVIVSVLYTVSLTVEGIATQGSKFFIVYSFPRLPVSQTIPLAAAACSESSSVTVPINSKT